jgi:hypothetical protein
MNCRISIHHLRNESLRAEKVFEIYIHNSQMKTIHLNARPRN